MDLKVKIWGEKLAKKIQICFCGVLSFKYWTFTESSQNFRKLWHITCPSSIGYKPKILGLLGVTTQIPHSVIGLELLLEAF